MRTRVWSQILIAATITALSGGLVASSSAGAATTSRVRPGAPVTISGVHCTVGLLLHQGKTVYAAVPASCGALPLNEGKPQWGCGARGNRTPAASVPPGAPAHIAGAQHRAFVVYDSFTRMQGTGVKRTNECQFNDMILLKLSATDARTARATIPGSHAPKRVSGRAPENGTRVSIKHTTATAAASTHHGWVYPLTNAPGTVQADLGTPIVHGSSLFGMLTILPQGTVMKSPAAASNLSRAIAFAKRSPGFHHLALLKAGQKA